MFWGDLDKSEAYQSFYKMYITVYTRAKRIKKKKANERRQNFGSVLSHLTRRLGKTHTVSESTLRHAVSAK
jgi:hypothetical protein